ncbi:GNAT family N-acetyltransferase [Cellulophaga tyrosinoxydans]|nr:GNAT family N-acetyltransferase [Cellulophaga tyrosinoxydans]
MHQISEDISLITIQLKDQKTLFELMSRIYPPVYAHYWPDNGTWYLDSQYSKENLKKELSNPNSSYYFIKFKNTEVGILRFLTNEPLEGFTAKNAIKLHRIYIDSNLHGKGIGKKLICWLEANYKSNIKTVLWLEAMEMQQTAIDFYEHMGFKRVSKFKLEIDYMLDNMKGMYRMAKDL